MLLVGKFNKILFAYDFLDFWDDDLARMNDNKNDKPYSFIHIIGHIRIYFHLHIFNQQQSRLR